MKVFKGYPRSPRKDTANQLNAQFQEIRQRLYPIIESIIFFGEVKMYRYEVIVNTSH